MSQKNQRQKEGESQDNVELEWPTVLGLVGVVGILLSYFLLHLAILKAESLTYSLINALGALLIIYSLLFAWNLPAMIVEVSWVLISLYGIYKYYKKKLDRTL